MRALLLAAGLGTRLHPITQRIPKCLVPIRGRPLLDYWFDHLFGSGIIERALVNTHYLAQQVEQHVAQSPWAARIDLVYEDKLLGTAGTIKANRSYFSDESFLVAHADNLTTFDVESFVSAHVTRPPDCAMTILTFHTDDPRSCGIVELDTSGVVTAFHEKVQNPPGNLANGAIYLVAPELADFIADVPHDVIDFSTEVIPHFVGHILAVEGRGYHRDIGTIDSWKRANEDAAALFPGVDAIGSAD
jgi:mannose-1-phosphate guanylyltransferase